MLDVSTVPFITFIRKSARVTLAFGNPYGEREGFAYKTVDFSLVRAGRLSFCSRHF